MAKQRVGICGLGVVGRQLLRELLFKYSDDFEVMLLNDANITTANLAYLLKFDSVYHEYENKNFEYTETAIVNDGISIPLSSDNPVNAPWGTYGVNIVFDCTGRASISNDLSDYILGGARRAISLAAKGYDNTLKRIVYGVNQSVLKSEDARIVMPSIEAQVAANALSVIQDNYDISSGMMHAFGAYTNSQNTIDSANIDFALGRAAAWNITPLTADEICKDIGDIIANLNGRLNGVAYRAPVINGGVIDLTLELEKSVTRDDLNGLFQSDKFEVITRTDDDLTSSDATGLDKFQVIANRTAVDMIGGNFANMSIIYDNIRGQALQAIRLAKYIEQNGIM